ncbi:YfcE family phosphodiesterase [Cetobacterium sp. SF1]|uniref:YfcE family phosphodiesterase n=1 Tax=unclassified Cetobacterium TaxID=2630983 RepID=UPI003CF2B13E
MKILVISDSHGRSEYILEAIEKEKPDMVISCGDYSEDAQDMAYGFPEIPFQIVRGNCDYYDIDHRDEILLEISSIKFYITHGHLQNAKGTYSKLETAGEKAGAKVVLFGHTHIPYLEKKKKVILFNPGALMNKEYGIINIFKDSVDFIHKKI